MSDYRALQAHYEACLAEHGDNHLGVNWKSQEDADRRHQVMLDLIPPGEQVTLLDFGCGTGHFYDYLRARGRTDIVYAGLDISPKFVALARAKHPQLDYYCLDVLADASALPEFDYLVLNGVFTNKTGMSHAAMWEFCQALLLKLVPLARRGLAFNAMSKHVDWEREDLFHLPFDTIAGFLHAQGWRRYTIRADYGLYDYTLYIHR
jgi:SAM-dependent methyltransferase